jgi:hypothetical protein
MAAAVQLVGCRPLGPAQPKGLAACLPGVRARPTAKGII